MTKIQGIPRAVQRSTIWGNVHPALNFFSYSKRDLSETGLTKLPTRGLESLEVLELRDAPALREFPSVYHFRFIRVAHLTYPYHCCAFQFPETHNPEEHSR
ncbi:hypothetical protein HPB48_002185 [Haemaphysalis longicornis]|uniref:Uncharacterized protein n=1 Tax=Haemaphysalis longicornis TaxID=44386 RepID=A0A9J6FHC1_HAELO|nr:hypothetical protein HPB48_002185 [Haemaphysalis longicornis]